MKTFKDLLNSLASDSIDDITLTKPVKKDKKFTKVKDNIPLLEDYNFMADIVFLPTTNEDYKYLLVVCDLATDEFDIEPLKTKDSASVLKAMKKMFTRDHIKQPKASIRTDGGSEFKDEFHNYLFDNNILHRVGIKNRHKQQANVERLNRSIGHLLNIYMNQMEKKKRVTYREWTDVINKVRTELNEVRKKDISDVNVFTDKGNVPSYIDTQPKFKVDDLVYRKLDAPMDALGHYQDTKQFREGDYRWDHKNPRRIKMVLYYTGNVLYRYLISGLPNVSYAETELMKADEKKEEKEEKKQIDIKVDDIVAFYGNENNSKDEYKYDIGKIIKIDDEEIEIHVYSNSNADKTTYKPHYIENGTNKSIIQSRMPRNTTKWTYTIANDSDRIIGIVHLTKKYELDEASVALLKDIEPVVFGVKIIKELQKKK